MSGEFVGGESWCKILGVAKKQKRQAEVTVGEGQQKSVVRLLLTGFAMGSADIVPGVSGGTIALILGVYEQLVESIKNVTGEVLVLVLGGKFRQAVRTVPWRFLVPLGLGIFGAFFTLARLITHLLETQQVFVWAFFFGLVVASLLLVGKRVSKWNVVNWLGLVLAAIVAYMVVGVVPIETSDSLWAFFGAGGLAIVAMILPGISGSLLLVIMGKYNQVLEAVANKEIVTLVVFMAGAAVGISVFSRILSWLLVKNHDLMMAVLTGFMLGSLRKVWPYKQTLSTTLDRHGEIVPLNEINVLPGIADSSVWISVGLALFGALLIVYLDSLDKVKGKAGR